MTEAVPTFVFPEPVVASPQHETDTRGELDMPGDSMSRIPTSNPCTEIIVNWSKQSITTYSDLETNQYWYPFTRCYIKSVWLEDVRQDGSWLERRAVLVLCSKSHLHYTLAPTKCHRHECDIQLLVKALGAEKVVQHTRGWPHRKVAEINLHQKSLIEHVLTEPHVPLDMCDNTQVTVEKQLSDLRQTPINNFTELLTQWYNILFTSCKFSNQYYDKFLNKTGLTDSRFGKQIFGAEILWNEEPILPVQLFCARHGQEMSDVGTGTRLENGTHLTELGKQQSLRLAAYLSRMTDNFRGTLGLWSSRTHRTGQTADIIKHYLESYPEKRHTVPHIINNLLGPLCPADDYQFDMPSKKRHRKPEQTLEELKTDVLGQIQASTEGRWLISAALRGTGILVPLMHQRGHPFNFQKFGVNSEALPECRLPPVPDVFGFESPLVLEQRAYRGNEYVAANFIYSGHAHTLAAQILDECQFPPYMWRHIVLPHCAVIPTGLHHAGKPSIIIADAAYLTNFVAGVNIPYTYTPHFVFTSAEAQRYCRAPTTKHTAPQHTAHTGDTHTAGTQNRSKLITSAKTAKSTLSGEPMVSLLPDDEWYDRQIISGVRYNAPSETYTMEKNILMIRAGHNRVIDGVDNGLTELGRSQLTAASAWLSKFLTCGRIILPPERWAIAGLTSAQSSIDATLRESIMLLKVGLETDLQTSRYDRLLVPDETCLFPENLFAPAEVNRVLQIVVADDYHLLKYFGACFGVSPATLQCCYWPHAAYCLVTQTEAGWPELRVFGNVSYLPPTMITISPKREEGTTLSEVKGFHSAMQRVQADEHLQQATAQYSAERTAEDDCSAHGELLTARSSVDGGAAVPT